MARSQVRRGMMDAANRFSSNLVVKEDDQVDDVVDDD